MNLIENIITIPMTLGAGYTIDYSDKALEPFLTGTLTYLDDMIIPSSVTGLRNYQFQDFINLTTVNLEYMQRIGISTFSGCAIESLNLPALVSSGMSSFAYNPFSEVTFPSLLTVGNQMFRSCHNLQRAEFPVAIGIDRRAFYQCESFDTLILGSDSVVSLNNDAPFYGTKIESGEGFIYVASDLVEAYQEDSNWALYASQIRSMSELSS